jgi:hypothetical protein
VKKTLLCIFLFFSGIYIKAQELNVTYGGLFGINTSFIDSKTTISSDYLNFDPAFVRNMSLLKKSKADLGYNFGLFLRVLPVDSRISFESEMLVAKSNNSYTISVNWEHFYTSNQEWTPVEDKEKIDNDFNIIKIPLTIGYDLIKKEKSFLTFLCGMTPNINMHDDHIKVDYQDNELPLFKSFFLSYHSGLSINFNKIFGRLNYERSFNLKKTQSREYFPYSMDVERLYLNSISISFGIYLN